MESNNIAIKEGLGKRQYKDAFMCLTDINIFLKSSCLFKLWNEMYYLAFKTKNFLDLLLIKM